MLNETELKAALHELAGEDFKLAKDTQLAELIPAMLQYIGTTDSVLRDDLIYSAFNLWILKYKVVDPETLHGIALKAISNSHIYYKIGEIDSDSVFRRTFSMLLLPLVLIFHRSQPLLSRDEIMQIKTALLRYTREEKDLRGYVDTARGWAHSVAHCADALDDLARCNEMEGSDLREILQTLTAMLCRQDGVYNWGEEERLATVILAVLDRQLLPEDELDAWIQGLADAVLAVNVHPQKMILRSNIKNFLQSLYFRVRWEFGSRSILDSIDRALYRISPYTEK